MNYLLDTNICIYFFKGQFYLRNKIEKIGFDRLAISEITLAELIFGAENSQNISKNLKVVEDFSKGIKILPIFNCIKFYAKEKARLKSIGSPIGDLDLFIAATAVVNNYTMVTRNIREFDRINGIVLENWID